MEQGVAGESDFAFRRCVIVWVFREQARSYRSAIFVAKRGEKGAKRGQIYFSKNNLSLVPFSQYRQSPVGAVEL